MSAYVSASEAAVLLGVSRQRVHQMLAEEKIAGIRVGSQWVFMRDDVLALRKEES